MMPRFLGSKIGMFLLPVMVVAVVLLAGIPLGWYQRPHHIPDIDLSHTRAEVRSAIETAISEVRKNPRSAVVWGKLGMVLRANDFDTDSVKCLRVAEELDPEEPRWPYLQGLTLALFDPARGLECLRRAVERTQVDRPEPRYRLAELLLELGRAEEAEEVLQPLLSRSALDPRALLLSARVAWANRLWSVVLKQTETLRDHPSARKRATMMRVDAWKELNRLPEAQQEAERLVQLPEDLGWPDYYVREVESYRVDPQRAEREASRYLTAGNPRAGVAMLEQAIRADPANQTARLMLAQVLIENGNALAALPLTREVLRLNPNSVEGWFRHGVAQFLVGDNAGARDSFTRVVQLKPDHALGHFNLGHARKKLGDRKGAIEAFQAAIRCRPDYDPWRVALAEIQNEK